MSGKTIFMAALAAMLLAAISCDLSAQTTTQVWRTTAPVDGGYPDGYKWFVCLGDSMSCAPAATSVDTFCTLTVPTRETFYVRVLAYNQNGEGPLSLASEVVAPGPPGACGRPSR